MKTIAKARAVHYATVDVTCPHCGHEFDLVEYSCVNDTKEAIRLLEAWWSVPSRPHGEDVECPECCAEMRVETGDIKW